MTIRSMKPGPKPQRIKDGDGLFLELRPNGAKWWRFRYYKPNGKEGLLSFGVYPGVGLKEARQKREVARRMVADGLDPAVERKVERAAPDVLTLEKLALEWHERFLPKWTPGHAQDIIGRLRLHIFPHIGQTPAKDLAAPELRAALRRIESRGAMETAKRVLQIVGQVLRYGVASGYLTRDIAADLRGALGAAKPKHHAAILDAKGITGLLRAIDGYQGHPATYAALRLAPLLFLRPGELRGLLWEEVDLDAEEIRIGAERMKMREAHIVPLARQAKEILLELHPLTGHGKYVFPSLRSSSRCMSENTVNAALRRLGYAKDEMTGHGFRSMASTILNEQGWPSDAIERQLAHRPRNKVRAAYNHAQHLDVRRKMLAAWADYLDGLKTGAKVTPLHVSMGGGKR
ncbi:MAG: tyrosine-type recombinase/integrase [Desulfovibrionaceae bacterium]|nr:tyrosine-type recombinase/integrase [Desulfovibrionaceae bacterium]